METGTVMPQNIAAQRLKLKNVRPDPVDPRGKSTQSLPASLKGALGNVDLKVLDRDNSAEYWERESRHDTVVSLSYGQAALEGFCRVVEAWAGHLLGVTVRVQPLREIEEARWAWHVGLDAESTSILNDLWNGLEVENGRMRRIVALFRLEFSDQADMRADLAGQPVYMALAANAEDSVRMKPQNLLRDEAGAVKVGDFGSARVQNLVGLTTTSMFMGAPQYVAPPSPSSMPTL